MTEYNILVLTDHSGHSDQNSLYALTQALRQHPACASIYVASRGLSVNDGFFQSQKADQLFGSRVQENFQFHPEGAFFKQDLENLNPLDFQILFLRLPRPISDEFLSWLDSIFSDTAVIINHPDGIMLTSSKQYLLNFSEHCPPIQLCYSVEAIESFAAKQDCVLKPLKEYGGKGILKITGQLLDDGQTTHDRKTYLEANCTMIEQEGYLAMKYLKNVSQGDKRILVVNGEILATSLRLPAEGSWLCNIAQGGKSVPSTPTSEEKYMIEAISPSLLEQGILIYGADTLVDDDGKRVLSEINTLSIGGFPQAEQQTRQPILKITANKIMEYAIAQL